MLYAYNNATQTVQAGGNIVFSTTAVNGNPAITHIDGTAAIILRKPGEYLITFESDFIPAASGTEVVQMYANGQVYVGAEASATVTASEISHLGINAGIKVLPNCCVVTTNNPVSITFQSSAAGTVGYTSVTVVKVK